jgi:hypothetical protein
VVGRIFIRFDQFGSCLQVSLFSTPVFLHCMASSVTGDLLISVHFPVSSNGNKTFHYQKGLRGWSVLCYYSGQLKFNCRLKIISLLNTNKWNKGECWNVTFFTCPAWICKPYTRCRKPSSGILRRVFLVRTDVSEERIASIIRAGERNENIVNRCLQTLIQDVENVDQFGSHGADNCEL